VFLFLELEIIDFLYNFLCIRNGVTVRLLDACHGLTPASNKGPHSLFCCPSFCWGGEENQKKKKKAKLLGWGKDILPEQQRKVNSNNNNTNKNAGIHRATRCPVCS